MRRAVHLVRGLALAVTLSIAAAPAPAQNASDYRVRDLLEPCVEGDNGSRGGSVLEMECEQYVSGFTDLYLRAGLAARNNLCLPPEGNRADEVRWANENFDKRDMPAVDGLIATLKWK